MPCIAPILESGEGIAAHREQFEKPAQYGQPERHGDADKQCAYKGVEHSIQQEIKESSHGKQRRSRSGDRRCRRCVFR